jgi:glyoxylase-like metal-dependent hydrolase (beta-lactamase superfamily II)
MPPGTPLLGSTSFTAPDDVRELTDGETLGIAETAGLVLRARHAPGHTPGSTLFELADGAATPVLFTGDVLFAGTIGRVDLPGGSMTEMQTSLRNIIVPMDDATVVHPGHGPSTTIGQERTGNPFLRELL